jgi:dTDP-4-dehydrorhamnose 3,5-epimerase
MEYGQQLSASPTPIPGMVVVTLPVHGDNRGWFKENWQRTKLIDLGLPDFGPVQNNISFNEKTGTTRGIHAEPWDKYVSVATGRIFGAWVDLREGATFGQTFTLEVDPAVAVFVPRGVGNAFQTLEPNTAYTYLVNDHWHPDAEYTFLNLADETANIEWPIPLTDVEISVKDAEHPRLSEVTPMSALSTLILGAGGQLGRALVAEFPGAIALTRDEFDVADDAAYASVNWSTVGTVINASAYTKVDLAETEDGRHESWQANVVGVGKLARICEDHRITLVHVSSDYVFDGEFDGEATENTEFGPLGVYGQTKAAGDALVSLVSKHYIVRTSWVIGDGNNFVRTMERLAESGVNPDVVDDQFGRLTFTTELSRAILHLLEKDAPCGTYNVTNSGDVVSWFDIAREVFMLKGHDAARVTPISAAQFAERNETAERPIAPRPGNSALNLDKLRSTGFVSADWRKALTTYLSGTVT